jgi:hypothetical protein
MKIRTISIAHAMRWGPFVEATVTLSAELEPGDDLVQALQHLEEQTTDACRQVWRQHERALLAELDENDRVVAKWRRENNAMRESDA